MKQIIYIHWWTSFPNNDAFCEALKSWNYKPFTQKIQWVDWLAEQTKWEFEVFHPAMPNKYNANYKAWKIWFEKIFPFLNDEDTILIGHSLGGMFMMKYLTEEWFPKQISKLYLISSVSNNKIEYLWDFEVDLKKISILQDLSKKIVIYHSTDDSEVPYTNSLEIHANLPKAELIPFSDRGHFRQREFPELLENIVR